MITKNNVKKGKAIEHYIISELLKNDFDVFVPVVDTGIDLIIKDKEGGLVEIQVKSRMINDDEDCFFIKSFEPRHNFFIVCHNINDNVFYVLASKVFHRLSELYEENGKKKLKIPYHKLRRRSYYANNEGIKLLKKALISQSNRVKLFLNKEDEEEVKAYELSIKNESQKILKRKKVL